MNKVFERLKLTYEELKQINGKETREIFIRLKLTYEELKLKQFFL